MPGKQHWIVIPLSSIGVLAVILMIAATTYKLANKLGDTDRGFFDGSPTPTEATGGHGTETKKKARSGNIEQLPPEDPDRERLIALTDEVNSLAPLGQDAGLPDLQNLQKRLSEMVSRLEESVDDVSPDHHDILEDLKDEVRKRQVAAWEHQLDLIDRKISELTKADHLRTDIGLLKDSIAQFDSMAQEVGGREIEEIREKLRSSERALQTYRPTLQQIEVMIADVSSSRRSLIALCTAVASLIFSLILFTFSQRAIRYLKKRLQDPSQAIDFRNFKENVLYRLGQLENSVQRSPTVPLTDSSQHGQIERRRDRQPPEREYQQTAVAPQFPSRELNAAPESPLSPTSNGFIGKLSELLPLIPSSNTVMQYDPVYCLLLAGNPVPGPKYHVFRDPSTQEYRVLPRVERATQQQELYYLEPVFDLEGGGGAVALVQHPQLEPSGSGFRIASKGLLRIG